MRLSDALVASSVLAVGLGSFVSSLNSSGAAVHDMERRDLAQAAMVSTAERLRASDFSTVYASWKGARVPVKGLASPGIQQGESGPWPATVNVQFDVNEITLPVEYGPLTDIDGDGVRGTNDASGKYLLLPVRLTLSYRVSQGTETKTLHLVLRG